MDFERGFSYPSVIPSSAFPLQKRTAGVEAIALLIYLFFSATTEYHGMGESLSQPLFKQN